MYTIVCFRHVTFESVSPIEYAQKSEWISFQIYFDLSDAQQTTRANGSTQWGIVAPCHSPGFMKLPLRVDDRIGLSDTSHLSTVWDMSVPPSLARSGVGKSRYHYSLADEAQPRHSIYYTYIT